MHIEQSGTMNNEQSEVVKTLQFALKMEADGKEFYLNASHKSNNDLGRELFERLAAEEDKHGQKFQEIFEVIKQKKSWPEIDIPSDTENIKTVFTRNIKLIDTTKMSASPQEFDAIDTALDMENQSRKFYQEQIQKTVYPAGKEFYQSLVAEERGHYLALTDYREYLSNPAAWYTAKEHPSLDGG